MPNPIIAILITWQYNVPNPIRTVRSYDITDHDISVLAPGAQHRDFISRPPIGNIHIWQYHHKLHYVASATP